jgi:hypothetical protein
LNHDKVREQATKDRTDFKEKLRKNANKVSLVLLLVGLIIWYVVYVP